MLPDAENITVAVVGLGLMGSSIATNFLIAGHQVIGVCPLPHELAEAKNRIAHHLTACEELDLPKHPRVHYASRMHITEDYSDLQNCNLVLECVVEDLGIKAEVLSRIEKNVSNQCVIASNTSAIPITTLQEKLNTPARFLGLHWSEPAYGSRFLEIICGDHTDIKIAEETQQLGTLWGKEPILVRKDIRGFVLNRLMYAVYREGLHLHEQGKADLASLDKAFKYDTGSWITVMGIFQRMDYLGIAHFATLAERTFAQLSNTKLVPEVMRELVLKKGRGIHNQHGLYPYTLQEAEHWKEAFEKFSKEIYQLSSKPDEVVQWEQEDQEPEKTFQKILVIGNDQLSCSLAVCLARTAQSVTWHTATPQESLDRLHLLQQDMAARNWANGASISVTDQWPDTKPFQLVFISNQTPIDSIKGFIQDLQKTAHSNLIISIGTAGIPLSEFQAVSKKPENIVGVNWAEPAHTTYFMEIVANEITDPDLSAKLLSAGKNNWRKDPYLIQGELGVQNKLISALIREALYLVKNKYAAPSDIDRACRTDPGMYLPFAGNFRYMDLMGTYLYGVVMEQLNKELSTDNSAVEMLQQMVAEGQVGLQSGKGFYTYEDQDVQTIDQKMRTFSFAISQLMKKYMES